MNGASISELVRRSPFEREARRLADLHEIQADDMESFVARTAMALAYRAFQEAARPIYKAKANLYACIAHPPVLLHEDGRIEILQAKFTPEVEAAFSGLDAMLDQLAESLGLTLERR